MSVLSSQREAVEDELILNLNRVDLRAVELKGRPLVHASLQRSNLLRAILEHADLRDIDFVLAKLDHANLRGADLTGANLSAATMDHTDVKGAKLNGATLYAADLSGLHNHRDADFRGAKVDDDTKLPNDFGDREARGLVVRSPRPN